MTLKELQDALFVLNEQLPGKGKAYVLIYSGQISLAVEPSAPGRINDFFSFSTGPRPDEWIAGELEKAREEMAKPTPADLEYNSWFAASAASEI